jgi:hypothetical protein
MKQHKARILRQKTKAPPPLDIRPSYESVPMFQMVRPLTKAQQTNPLAVHFGNISQRRPHQPRRQVVLLVYQGIPSRQLLCRYLPNPNPFQA